MLRGDSHLKTRLMFMWGSLNGHHHIQRVHCIIANILLCPCFMFLCVHDLAPIRSMVLAYHNDTHACCPHGLLSIKLPPLLLSDQDQDRDHDLDPTYAGHLRGVDAALRVGF